MRLFVYAGVLAVLSVVVVVGGCADKMPQHFVLQAEPSPEASDRTDRAEPIVLRLGDELEVLYLRQMTSDQPYRIGVDDQLHLTVRNRPELAETSRVLPDGTITLPLVGQVAAAGHTVASLTEALEARYAEYLESPRVSVLVREAQGMVGQFLAQLRDTPTGPSRQVQVAEDGQLHLPVIGSVPAVDRRLDEVSREIEQAYAEQVPGLRVSVAIDRRGPRFVSVMGEVLRAGAFEMPERRLSLMQALSLAGGVTDRAHLKQVLRVRPKPSGEIHVTVVNLKSAFEGDDGTAWSIALAPRDVLFVPRSPIADVNVFVDQFIRQNIPLDIGAGFAIPVFDDDD